MIRRMMILSFLMIPTVSLSALPPSAESLRRLKVIVESPAVFEKLNVNDHVTGIYEKEEGYVVTTDQCKLYVSIQETDLSQIEPNLVGPPKLDVKIGDMKCQKGGVTRKRNIEKTRANIRSEYPRRQY